MPALSELVTLAGGTVSVIVFVLDVFTVVIVPSPTRSPELCCLETYFLGIVCCLIEAFFLAMGNDSEGILSLATFGDRSPFF
jgi:hypothetical protein